MALTESDRILLKEHSMPGKYHEADKWVLLGKVLAVSKEERLLPGSKMRV